MSTELQKEILGREIQGNGAIYQADRDEDSAAIGLNVLGFGLVRVFGRTRPWRKRSGYVNHFIPNEKGLELIRRLKVKDG